MTSFVLGFEEIGRSQGAIVGGKATQLGELARLDGVHVPSGFCVTTVAFDRVVATAPGIAERLDALSLLTLGDRDEIRALSAELRGVIEGIVIPEGLAEAITGALATHGANDSYAVRSSATAEDLPTASFAGQQDSFLDVTGGDAVLRCVRGCWASLFTERAVTYRLRQGFDHRKVRMAVIVQRMVFPDAAGILFTADPLNGNRRTSVVEATFGLGEALASGLVNADTYRVRNGQVIERSIAGERSTLDDARLLRLDALGRRIEAHFGDPQDIEWCLAGDDFAIVQSRPITTLFPVPAAADARNHVYVSVGHQQMMTDPMKPLGISVWQMTAARPMHEAGGRVFVDVSPELSSAAGRAGLLGALGKSDPLIGDALRRVIDRGFITLSPQEGTGAAPAAATPAVPAPDPIPTDPAIPAGLIARSQASIAALTHEIRGKSGLSLLDFILADFEHRKRALFEPQHLPVIMAGMEAAWWLNDHLQDWLGETNAADTLAQSAPGNVTSEMGLALLDVADAIRPHPEVVAFLEQHAHDGFLDELPRLAGGREARNAIQGWLDRYGMRGPGEIDITRPRWSEHPAMLVPLILGNVRNFPPGEASRRFDEGLRQARDKERELLARLRSLPGGEDKAEEAKRMIDRLRTFIGYREYPKYGIVSRFFVYKRALMEEADRLVQARVLRDREDIFFLSFPELRDVVRTQSASEPLIAQRKEAFRSYHALTPPRVLTSDGEAITGSYRRDALPAGTLAGLPVSAGTVEGRARVILDMAGADLQPGDILVTPWTDPSWTPLFVAIAGLVTEVGGLMTHGAVIAREYGVPAVVGVEQATRRIRDGQWIRVHGTEGHVEILR